MEQTYLLKPEDQSGYTYIRRRGHNGSYHYSYSVLRDLETPQEQNTAILERQISGREWVALLKQADPTRVTVKKHVRCFVYNNQYFQLNTFLEPEAVKGMTILETEAEDKYQQIELPSWIQTEKEVTEHDEYSSYQIAKFRKVQQNN